MRRKYGRPGISGRKRKCQPDASEGSGDGMSVSAKTPRLKVLQVYVCFYSNDNGQTKAMWLMCCCGTHGSRHIATLPYINIKQQLTYQ